MLVYKYCTHHTGNISYDILIQCIQNVSKNNYFMNYGLWDDTDADADVENNTLLKANKKLVDFVFEKTGLLNKKDMNILDVGCGYGEQDIDWCNKLDKSCKLKAIDISEEQIYFAMKKNSNVTFDICDAKYIDLKYKNESFDVIISLESAFHYADRPKFFKDVNTLLKDDGKFIITDIMLNKTNNSDFITNLFLKIFSDFLHIPTQNLITSDVWDTQISKQFNVGEMYDITDKTFNPYYKHFMEMYIKNNNIPSFVSNILTNFFCSVQPFTYKIAVCEKRNTSIVV